MNQQKEKCSPEMVARQRVPDYFPGLSPKSLANLNSKGEGPTPHRMGRIVFYKFSDLKKCFKR